MLLVAGRFFLSCLLIWLVVTYVRDLVFYWRNGWNFDENHAGFELHSEEKQMIPISNRSRIRWYYPSTILVVGLITLVFYISNHMEIVD